MGTLQKITRRLCGTRQKCSTVIRYRGGRLPLIVNRRQSGSSFKKTLNQPCPLNTAAPSPASKDLYISLNKPTVREVADAIKSLKNVNATGIDAIDAEMLKVDLPTSVGVLCLFLKKSLGTRGNT